MSLPADASRPPSQDAFETARLRFLGGLDQLARGELVQAEQSFLDSLALLPGRVSTLINLAAVRVRLARPADAIEAADQVLAQEPRNADAWFQRGEALAQMARLDEALAAFGHAAANQRTAVPWYRHGQVLQDLQRDDEALRSYQNAVAAEPRFAPAWTNQGNILRERGRLDEAANAFRQAVAHGGSDALHDYYLASVSQGGQQAASSAPVQYVQGLFDAYAEGFDHHVVEVLGYQAPDVLADELFRIAPARWFDSMLDLGCGTGLAGQRLKSCSDRRVGVDLSAQMLAKAQRTGCYAELVQQDIAAYLESSPDRFDLVVSADVFIYVGDLAAVFAGVRRVMEPDGLFCFSLEAMPRGQDAEFRLQPTLRFAHSEGYARRMAAEHGFEVMSVKQAPLRQDQRRAIDGLFVCLRKKT